MKNDGYRTPVVIWRSKWVELGEMEVRDKKGNISVIPRLVLVGVRNKEHHSTKRKK